MPRKTYLQDLESVSKVQINGISDIKPLSDGEFTFILSLPKESTATKITVLIPEVSDYPSSHECLIFASDDAPVRIAAQLENAPGLSGKTIVQALQTISRHFAPKLVVPKTDSDGDSFIQDADEAEQLTNDFGYDENDSDADGTNEDWAADEDELDQLMGLSSQKPVPKGKASTTYDQFARSLARKDLVTARNAGFKVSALGLTGSSSNPCFVSISCRIGKLGISEEALEAWDLDASQYLILLLHYQSGYKTLQELHSNDGGARSYVEMKIGVSDYYKPRSMEEALSRFQSTVDDRGFAADSLKGNSEQKGFRDTFISRPLNELLNTRLISILKFRLAHAIGWDGAERLYNDKLGTGDSPAQFGISSYKSSNDENHALALIVVGDQMQEATNESHFSFPLIAMQFSLRHFVRCTEFCLICFTKLNTDVEAIKPYVCSKPLCLFQYMSLGFGPSIEPEILSQPYVVDLLISFCFSSAAALNLHDFPEGLGLNVPNPENNILNWTTPTIFNQFSPGVSSAERITPTQPSKNPVQMYEARLDKSELELLFDIKPCPVKKGDWIVLNVPKSSKSWHCKIKDVILFPTVRISDPIDLKPIKSGPEPESAPPKDGIDEPGWQKIEFHIYERNFDQLGTQDRSLCIQMLLSILPSVQDMMEYLVANPGKTLAHWTDRFPPAALAMLRWIIASNRSCIMQVDRPEVSETAPGTRKSENRVQGMSNYMQFRFAMGAPDKEQRFINSIKDESVNKNQATLFAWHGSPLANWHSIIRQGLHFNKTSHGRAFGHGCYHAKDLATSLGYSRFRQPSQSWPQSQLQIGNVIALSEIVNAPNKFVSQNPYYVVSQLDWIQTRYLFVQPLAKIPLAEDSNIKALQHDPHLLPNGADGTRITLPITAIPRSRRPCSKEPSTSVKRIKTSSGKAAKGSIRDYFNVVDLDDNVSVVTDDEDLDFLVEEDDPITPPLSKPHTPKIPTEPVTLFKPRTIQDLPLLPSPPFATPSASKSLQKDFRTLMQVQGDHIKNGTLHELGWWMDPEHITRTDNLYQWIIQLHSFPLSLPLAQDMKKQSAEGIVMELRFPASYPYAPPFLRVVRPRFLPFQNGGGGHVTAGGSICMELLTNDGWSAVNSIESVLLQVRMAIMSTDPRPARLSAVTSYSVGEAVDSFKRACLMHGWRIPADLEQTAFAGSSK